MFQVNQQLYDYHFTIIVQLADHNQFDLILLDFKVRFINHL